MYINKQMLTQAPKNSTNDGDYNWGDITKELSLSKLHIPVTSDCSVTMSYGYGEQKNTYTFNRTDVYEDFKT